MEYTSGIMTLCIPYASLEPIREKLQAGYQSEQMEIDGAWAQRFKDCLMLSHVDVLAQLGRTQISGKDLLNLQIGDVVRLDQYAADASSILVEGVVKFIGYPCNYKGNQAVQISQVITGKERYDYGTE